MGRLDGKTAIITASTEGIGFAIAEKFAKEGANVVVSSRKQKNVDKAVKSLTSQGLSVIGCVCHVGKKEHRQKMIDLTLQKYGGIDILVSNAAVNPAFGPIMETSEEAWDKIFEINVKASFFLSKEVFPHLKNRGGGSIVFVSSVGGYKPSSYQIISHTPKNSKMLGAYATSKTTMIGMAKAMAGQLAENNIRINCIAPGLIKTNFSQALWSNEAIAEQVVSFSPIKRIGRPEECAGAAVFLASDEASYITGETIVIAGGEHARL